MSARAPINEGGEREALSVWHRHIELPRYLRQARGRDQLGAVLEEVADELGFARLCLASGPTVTRRLASGLAGSLGRDVGSPLTVEGNGERDVERLAAASELRAADALVAVGGGRTIDVAKSACELAGRPVVVVPTQLTTDGIASPVSVIVSRSGTIESRRARLPIGVVVDLEFVAGSPPERLRAGLGDLIANASALRDWRLAEAAGRESVDDFASLLAGAASDLVLATDVSSLGRGAPSPAFLERLLHGLVMSGLAMEIAGSSRPCSGAEHLISHAIDRLHPGLAQHGEQVAFGSLLAARFQGADWRSLRDLMLTAGMERAVLGFSLAEEEIAAAVSAAPATRPGRYTVLDEIELDGPALRGPVQEVLAG
jgi:glycerol-1-phosphate dehydrogenase [NAD(P)+]